MTQGHNEDTYYVIKSGEVNVYQAQAAQVQFPHTCTECIPRAEVIARITSGYIAKITVGQTLMTPNCCVSVTCTEDRNTAHCPSL